MLLIFVSVFLEILYCPRLKITKSQWQNVSRRLCDFTTTKTMCCTYRLFGFSFNLGSIKPGLRTRLAPTKKRVWQCVWWTFANDCRLRCTISPSFQTLLTQMVEIARVTECVWVFFTCRLLGFNIVLDTMKRLSTMKVARVTECGWATFTYRLLEFNNVLGTIKPAFQIILALIKVARVSECVSHVYF